MLPKNQVCLCQKDMARLILGIFSCRTIYPSNAKRDDDNDNNNNNYNNNNNNDNPSIVSGNSIINVKGI